MTDECLLCGQVFGPVDEDAATSELCYCCNRAFVELAEVVASWTVDA